MKPLAEFAAYANRNRDMGKLVPMRDSLVEARLHRTRTDASKRLWLTDMHSRGLITNRQLRRYGGLVGMTFREGG